MNWNFIYIWILDFICKNKIREIKFKKHIRKCYTFKSILQFLNSFFNFLFLLDIFNFSFFFFKFSFVLSFLKGRFKMRENADKNLRVQLWTKPESAVLSLQMV